MMELLKSKLEDRLLRDEPLARFTAARLGGPADWLYIARNSLEELVEVVSSAWEMGLPTRVLGAGANVLVADKGFRGLIIIDRIAEVTFGEWHDGRNVSASGGVSLTTLAHKCQTRGLSGLEWAISVPGTLGGAIVNNAGAHGSDMAGILCDAVVLTPEKGAQLYTLPDMDYAYRYSSLKAQKDRSFVVLLATLGLQRDTPEAIAARMDEFVAYRKQTQPPGASLGSIFKNPPGAYAGKLIETAGLKGYQVGQVQVSPVHANFLINLGNGSAQDYYQVIQHIQQVVEETSGILLELEIELVGEW